MYILSHTLQHISVMSEFILFWTVFRVLEQRGKLLMRSAKDSYVVSQARTAVIILSRVMVMFLDGT